MPDQRAHRGAHPEDDGLFAPAVLPALREAVLELSWLLSRGYSEASALKLVGDRLALRARQRMAVLRCACTDAQRALRVARALSLDAIADREIDVDWLDRHPRTPVRRHLERFELDGRRVYLLNRGSLVNLAAGLGIGAPQLFDPFAAIMLLGLDAILSGRTAELPNGVQRYPPPLEARVARALATGSV